MTNQSHAKLRIACALLLCVALTGLGCGGSEVPAGYGVGVAGAAGTAAGGMTGAAGDGGVAGGIAGAMGVAGAAGGDAGSRGLAGAAGGVAGASGLAGAAGGVAGASGLAGAAGGVAGASGLAGAAGGVAGASGPAGAAGGVAGSSGLAGAAGGVAGASGLAGAAGGVAGTSGLAGAAGGVAGASGLAGAAGGVAGAAGLAGAAGGVAGAAGAAGSVAGASGLAGAAGGVAGAAGLAGAAGGVAGAAGLAGTAGGVAGAAGLAGTAGGIAGSSGLAGAAGGLAGHGAAGIAGSGAAGATACTLDPPHNGSGSFTYYWFGQNPASEPPGYRTACGYYATASGTTDTVENIANTAPAKNTYFAAIPGHDMFDSRTNCGACAQITGPNGKTIIATIVDECPYGNDSTSGSNEPCASNPTGHLDLSRSAFDQLGYGSGNPSGTTWKIVPCPVTGNVKVRFKQGNDNEIFIENGVTSFSTVTINGLPAARQRYGAWHLGGAISLPAAIHTVDRYGRALDFTLASSSITNQDTGKQLPACQ